MTSDDRWAAPPRPKTEEGAARRIGIELEFANLSAIKAAEAVQERFGGEIERVTSHVVKITGGRLGDFTTELDMAYAKKAEESEFAAELRDSVTEIAAQVVPTEVVCPPVPWDQAHEIGALGDDLVVLGAEGTRQALLYAFGMQLNIEPPSLKVETLLATLRAYLLLAPWLRRQIKVDRLRRLWRFATEFRTDYKRLVLGHDYAPDLGQFIEDYLAHNPTRDRELDLLPLCRHLDEARVVAALPDEKINARPTWHWRLPNSELGDEDWSMAREWARWLAVEKLSEDAETLEAACSAWRIEDDKLLGDWAPHAARLGARFS